VLPLEPFNIPISSLPLTRDIFNSSPFRAYLSKVSNDSIAVQLCQHFHRITSLDETTPEIRHYLTDTSYNYGDDIAEIQESSRQHVGSSTALHDAVAVGNYSVVEYLIRTNFVVTALDEKGRSPIELTLALSNLDATTAAATLVLLIFVTEGVCRAVEQRSLAFQSMFALLIVPLAIKIWVWVEILKRARLPYVVDAVIDETAGASIHMSLFFALILVLVGQVQSIPLDFRFRLLETSKYGLKSLFLTNVLPEGRSKYLKGVFLIWEYLLLASANALNPKEMPLPLKFQPGLI
jgi:hypothetical protein